MSDPFAIVPKLIELIIPGPPLPYKATQRGKYGCYNPRWAEMKVMKQMIQDQYKGPIIEGAVECYYSFEMPIPSGTSKKKRELMITGHLRPIKRPDRDNLAKLASDLLLGIVIKDDSQIVGGQVGKWFSETPRTLIRITAL